MSVRVMSSVFDRYPNGGGEMLLALSLADHAHDDGTHIYPSVDSLALKTRQSVRAVQYQLKSMRDTGWLILVNEGNGGRGMCSEYRISADWLKGAEIAPIKKGANDDIKGAKQDTKGCNPLHPLYNHKEPSVNHQSALKRVSRATRLTDAWIFPKKFGDWALGKYPDWTAEFIRERGAKFRDHWSAIPGKAGLKTDWFATWRNFCLAEAEFIARTTRTSGMADASWWSSDPSILAEGAKRKLTPRPGESMFVFKGRVQAAIEAEGKPTAPLVGTPIVIADKGNVAASVEAVAARRSEIKKALHVARNGLGKVRKHG